MEDDCLGQIQEVFCTITSMLKHSMIFLCRFMLSVLWWSVILPFWTLRPVQYHSTLWTIIGWWKHSRMVQGWLPLVFFLSFDVEFVLGLSQYSLKLGWHCLALWQPDRPGRRWRKMEGATSYFRTGGGHRVPPYKRLPTCWNSGLRTSWATLSQFRIALGRIPCWNIWLHSIC